MLEYEKEIKEFIDNTTDAKLLKDNMQKVLSVISKVERKIEVLQEVERMNSIVDVTAEKWQNGKIHFDRLQYEGKMNESMMYLIPQMKCPSLLIKGKFDPVCFQQQLDFYAKNSVNGSIIIFDKSDHRPHDEEPTKFTETIIKFLSN